MFAITAGGALEYRLFVMKRGEPVRTRSSA
jgi:hypothetical protein